VDTRDRTSVIETQTNRTLAPGGKPPLPLAGLSFTSGGLNARSGLHRAERVMVGHLKSLGAAPADGGLVLPLNADMRASVFGDALNARCQLSGWGGLGHGVFSETLVQARCGLMAVHGRANGGPRRLGVDFAIVSGAIVAVQGVLRCCSGSFAACRSGGPNLALRRSPY